ncbi:MAG: ATP-binding protein, partial [Saprospiraceae bacterium]|nr:ATP-binding protein [Saprospiraceae bacterium]
NILITDKTNKLEISIRDNGIGIPDAEKSNVFTKFYRVGNEDTRNTKGTGLGLYIVKELASLHKATIKVKNNTPKGTIFDITFPLN